MPISEKLLQIIKCSAEKMEAVRWCGERIWSKSPLCTDGFHMQCYRRFTDKTKVAREVKRCTKVGQPSPDSCIDVPTASKSVHNVECSSSNKISDQPKRRNSNVFQSSASYVKERNILRIHIPRRDRRKSSQFTNTHQVSWK